MFRGTATTIGIGVGRAVLVGQERIIVARRAASDFQREQQRFLEAIGTFCTETLKLYHSVRENLGEKESSIISAQIIIITDTEFHKEVIGTIRRDHVSAEFAFCSVCDGYINLFSTMEDELMQARAADFKDIKHRLLSVLLDMPPQSGLQHIPRGSVLVAEDISPSQAVTLDPRRVCAIVTQKGSQYSHFVDIAKKLQIPVVVGVNHIFGRVREGDILVVDGHTGTVLNRPTVTQLKYFISKRKNHMDPIYLKPKLQVTTNSSLAFANKGRVYKTANQAI